MSPTGVYERTEEHGHRISEGKKGRPLSEEHKHGLSVSMTEERRQRISEFMKGNQYASGRRLSEEHKHKVSESLKGRILTEEHRRRISESKKGKPRSEKTRRKMSESMTKAMTEDYRRRISATLQGISLDEWDGFKRNEPYCHLFNMKKKEEIRNRYLRTCIISSESALQQSERLTVHHIDNNKHQGCNGFKWKLVPITRTWNKKLVKKQAHLLLNLLLIKNKRAEINLEEVIV